MDFGDISFKLNKRKGGEIGSYTEKMSNQDTGQNFSTMSFGLD